MSESSAEYLKRTCLICGCHTNQTINIYEPRSGPNIVQLIQAKFKFQPLNEDKYLCFSCNNWLINWHSLQALNSNDADSSSGTFRSHLNSGRMKEENSSGSKRASSAPAPAPAPVRRPVAHVLPRQATEREQVGSVSANKTPNRSSPKINFSKRSFCLQLGRHRRVQHRAMQSCSCGRRIVVRTRVDVNSAKFLKKTQKLRCRKCREAANLRANHEAPLVEPQQRPQQNLVNTPATPTNQSNAHRQGERKQRQPWHRPLVDGKVVSMLRRLGTTLSREPVDVEGGRGAAKLPPIMSPAKPKPRWTRSLEADEVLLNFDATISEVLPTIAARVQLQGTGSVRRRLTFQVAEVADVADVADVIDLSERSEEGAGGERGKGEGNEWPPQVDRHYHNSLPCGRSVSLL